MNSFDVQSSKLEIVLAILSWSFDQKRFIGIAILAYEIHVLMWKLNIIPFPVINGSLTIGDDLWNGSY